MTNRPLADDLMAAVYQLTTAKPHEPDESRGYSRAEWPVYCEGYYTALVYALRVMELRVKLRALQSRERRRRRALERQAAASLPTHSNQVREFVGLLELQPSDSAAERRESVNGNAEAVTGLRDGVVNLDVHEYRVLVGFEPDRDGNGNCAARHSDDSTAETSRAQLCELKESPLSRLGESVPADRGLRSGQALSRHVSRRRTQNLERKNANSTRKPAYGRRR